MEKKLLVRRLVIAMFLKLQLEGYDEISVRNDDVLSYASKLDELFGKENMAGADIFVKTPVEESYDQFKSFLISRLYGDCLASFNHKYDELKIIANPYFALKELNSLYEYENIINEGCFLIAESLDYYIADDSSLYFRKVKVK